jgi:hypothetical protein
MGGTFPRVEWSLRLFNHRRLHGEIGLIPPTEFEANHWANLTTEHYPQTPVLTEAGGTQASLHQTRGDALFSMYQSWW